MVTFTCWSAVHAQDRQDVTHIMYVGGSQQLHQGCQLNQVVSLLLSRSSPWSAVELWLTSSGLCRPLSPWWTLAYVEWHLCCHLLPPCAEEAGTCLSDLPLQGSHLKQLYLPSTHPPTHTHTYTNQHQPQQPHQHTSSRHPGSERGGGGRNKRRCRHKHQQHEAHEKHQFCC